ncbi:MAG: hypothetical protein GY851_21650 [bacterium]|nr:hypothetical protein [bacterium]
MTTTSDHRFFFENYGGSYQLRLQSGADLAALAELDEPFWMATSAPVNQLASDPVVLARLDRDGNGRIHSGDIRYAARWLLRMLRDLDGVTKRSGVLVLETLNDTDEEAQRLIETARRVLHNLGESGADAVSLDHVRDRARIFARGVHNGDGVIPVESVPEEDGLRAFVEDIAATMGSADDINGAPGVTQESLTGFLDNAKAFLAWRERADDGSDAGLMPFGADTADRYTAFTDLAPRIDAYFLQCDVVHLNRSLGREVEAAAWPAQTFDTESVAQDYLENAPLARPRAEGVLPLREGVNPHYAHALTVLAEGILPVLAGPEFDRRQLTHAQWISAKAAFTPFGGWLEAKAGGEVERLGIDVLRAYVEGDAESRLDALIDADLAAGKELDSLRDLEYLILLQRWIMDICNNFVSFACLYHPDQRAMFELGRMVMDGHVLNMNFRVADPDAHSAAAIRSGACLLYSEVTGGAEDPVSYVVTPITTGRIANLGVGKRGVLFDVAGKQWDTRVVKVVENPVNLREAILAPFRRIGAQISSTAERITAGAEQQVQAHIAQTSATVETGVKEGIAASATAPTEAPPAAPPAPEAKSGGLGGVRDAFLAGSVGVAALGSSFAFIAKQFNEMELGWGTLATVVIVGLTVIVVPTALIAFFRLRRRNLSAVLEASGWAINAPMRLTWGLRRLIAVRPAHPKRFWRLRKDLVPGLRSEEDVSPKE